MVNCIVIFNKIIILSRRANLMHEHIYALKVLVFSPFLHIIFLHIYILESERSKLLLTYNLLSATSARGTKLKE